MLPPALSCSIFGRWLKNIWSTHTHKHSLSHTVFSPWGTGIPGCPGYWFYGMPAWSDGTKLKWLLSEPSAEANTHIYKSTHRHKTQAHKHTWNMIIKATCRPHDSRMRLEKDCVWTEIEKSIKLACVSEYYALSLYPGYSHTQSQRKLL